MRVFVLCTGRCGSLTFAKACQHIENYTSGHESNSGLVRERRLHYEDNHIEVDNRLSWFLGALDRRFGDRAFYVHLKRNPELVADSFLKRCGTGIIRAYACGILTSQYSEKQRLEVCRSYVEAVNENINLFLRDKSNSMSFTIEYAAAQFAEFWRRIDAKGSMNDAVAEFNVRYNRT